MTTGPAIAVTGASGYIGEALIALLRERAIPFVALQRSAEPVPGALRTIPYDLTTPLVLPDDVALSAIVHLAGDVTGALPRPIEQRSLEALLDAADARGARLVFASSISAIAPASEYGARKAAFEQIVVARGHIAARIGLVYGGAARGLYGQLRKLAELSPFLPAIRPPVVSPVHITQVTEALLALALKGGEGIYHLTDEPIGFTPFLAAIRRHGVGKPALLLPVPAVLLRGMAAIAPRAIGERIRSLLATRAPDAPSSLPALGIKPMPLAEGLHG